MAARNAFKANCLLLIFIFMAGSVNSQIASGFKLVSSAFEEGKLIPAKYTCAGSNVSPTLSWTGAPEKTKSFAIIMDDSDAPMGIWVHWVMYNIEGTVNNLAEKLSVQEIKATDGLNSWGEKGYYGPCPTNATHRYIFKLYALDKSLTPKETMDKTELLEAMKGHILGEATLTGVFTN